VETAKKGDLQGAAGRVPRRAQAIDPSSPVAEQELRENVEMIAEKNRRDRCRCRATADSGPPSLASQPPEIKPLSARPHQLEDGQ